MLDSLFAPLLAKDVDFKLLKFPVYASPKLDGIRCITTPDGPLSRSLKPIPNRHISEHLSMWAAHGLDGELVVGDPSAKDVYNRTSSGVMSRDGEPDFTFLVFDCVTDPDTAFSDRLSQAKELVSNEPPRIKLHEHVLCNSLDEVLAYEAKCLEEGYEGLILRSPSGHYKYGRSTTREGIMLKLKRFEDSEAEILECVQLMSNGNAAQINELGHTFRSSSKEGLIPVDMVGAFIVRDLKNGWEFSIGSGSAFTHQSRSEFWENRDKLVGKIVKYKFFRHGMKDVPRHPNFLGFRSKLDL